MKVIAFVFSLFLISACSTTEYSDKNKKINEKDIKEIQFLNAVGQNCPKNHKEIYITDTNDIAELVAALNNAKVDGPWKGACFSLIKLIQKDKVLILSTNGQVFGHRSSGIFYRFSKDNIFEKFED